MALILAVNPQGRQTAALERLARELPGHELMGADSCAVALTAVHRRLPDLVLLPANAEAESGSAELLAHLRAVPGGVRTLTLPPTNSQAPASASLSFADQIRQCLASGPGRTQLIAAGFAVAQWIRARRSSWTAAAVREAVRQPDATVAKRLPVPAAAPPTAPPRREPAFEAEPIEEPTMETEPVPSLMSNAAAAAREWREPIVQWLSRVGALAVLIAIVAAGYNYWPKLQAQLTSGEVSLETGPPGSQVFIDGTLAGITPLTAKVTRGRHTIEFRSGDMTRTAELVVGAREHLVERVDWTTKPTGALQVESDPAGARVLVDGVLRGKTPLTVEGLTAGTHDVAIQNQEGTVRRSVTIADGKTAELSESIFSGSLAVFSPFEIEISEGTRQIPLDDRGRTTLPAGTHKLRFQNRALGYNEVRTVDIKAGETGTLNLVPQTTINISSTEPAEVSVDGAHAGSTPIQNLKINLGTRIVTVRNAAGDERRFPVTATAKPVQLDVDFSKPQ
jgi:PEGA domain-containing protein